MDGRRNPGLDRLVRLFGRQWKIMSTFFENKTSKQLKTRWSVIKRLLFMLSDPEWLERAEDERDGARYRLRN
jgi:hypothetical protein